MHFLASVLLYQNVASLTLPNQNFSPFYVSSLLLPYNAEIPAWFFFAPGGDISTGRIIFFLTTLGGVKITAANLSTLSVSLSTSMLTPSSSVAVSALVAVDGVGVAVVVAGVADDDGSKCVNIARWKVPMSTRGRAGGWGYIW